MRSELQIQASRANGAKSRGPITPEGKLASSQNAITHGMLSGTVVLKGESLDRFHQLVAELFEEFQPETPFEESLIENMAVARWRQMRIWGMEKAGMEHEMLKETESSSVHVDSATRAAIAFRTLSDESRSLDLINRYESRYERQYLRAHRRFIEVRGDRTRPSAQPLQPAPAPPEKVDSAKGTQDPPQPVPQENRPAAAHNCHRARIRPRFVRGQRLRSRSAGDLVAGRLSDKLPGTTPMELK